MDPMHEEMDRQRRGIVGEIVIHVKEEAVEDIFEDGPDEKASNEACAALDKGHSGNAAAQEVGNGCPWVGGEVGEGGCPLDHRAEEEIRRDGAPEHGHHIPLRPGENF